MDVILGVQSPMQDFLGQELNFLRNLTYQIEEKKEAPWTGEGSKAQWNMYNKEPIKGRGFQTLTSFSP